MQVFAVEKVYRLVAALDACRQPADDALRARQLVTDNRPAPAGKGQCEQHGGE